jgi:hypothetical protein
MEASRIVRPPSVAGMFYPADPSKLHEEINALLSQAGKKQLQGKVRGIIAPHAGYMYSGLTAAHAYATLKGERFETVVVVSPSHREYFSGVSVYPGDAYRTPLGTIEIDGGVRNELTAASDVVVASEQGHHTEHALEVQLPFLQETLAEFKLVPLVMGDQRTELCFGLGEILGTVLRGRNCLLVASTDLSHYYSSDVAESLDRIMIRDVQAFDYEHLMRDLDTRRTEACGGGPTVAVLLALKRLGVNNIEVLHYSTSGDVTGDLTYVVGYLSAVAYS